MDGEKYHILVRTSDCSPARTIELTRDEFVRLEEDLSAVRDGLPGSSSVRAPADVRLIQHRTGYGGKAERIHPAHLRRCLENNSYLRGDVLKCLRDLTEACG